MWQNGVRGSLEDIEGDRIRCKFMSIDETTARLVKGVAWQAVIDVELPGGFYCLGKSAHQAMNLLLRGLRSGHCVSASQSGKVLAERMSSNERMKIGFLVEVIGIVIPATQIGAWRRQPFTFPKRLQQTVFIEIAEQFMVLVELETEGAVKQFHFRVAENGE